MIFRSKWLDGCRFQPAAVKIIQGTLAGAAAASALWAPAWLEMCSGGPLPRGEFFFDVFLGGTKPGRFSKFMRISQVCFCIFMFFWGEIQLDSLDSLFQTL